MTRNQNEWEQFKRDAEERTEKKEQLQLLFKEKGILSIHDKRRIMNDVIGRKGSLGSIGTSELKQMIAYLEPKSKDDIQSTLIGWFSVTEQGKGMSKNHMRKLMTEIPATTDVVLLTLHADGESQNPLSIYRYISYDFYQDNEKTVHQALQTHLKEFAPTDAPSVYTLNTQLKVAPLKETVSAKRGAKQKARS